MRWRRSGSLRFFRRASMRRCSAWSSKPARELHGRVIWNVNSTAKGGGVVEMLRPLLGYCRGAGVDARWAVISGQSDFFVITKRIHNRLHGFAGDGGPLGDAEREVYEQTLAPSARELAKLVHPMDIVILHDPQTAGLAAAVRKTGATVMRRCHAGLDVANDHAREAWISCVAMSRMRTSSSSPEEDSRGSCRAIG